jgi:hypothetical protein
MAGTKSGTFYIAIALSLALSALPSLAQNAPLPGVSYPPQAEQPVRMVPVGVPMPTGSATAGSSPLPGSTATYAKSGTSDSTYRMLPLSPQDAKLRIEELKNLVLISKPQEVQDRIYNMCEWLVDMTEAHNKLANVFGKQDSLKSAAQSERAMAQKFAHLKNEAQLLKAELLIRQNRAPEALGPLVDIVANEPKGSAGVAAYKRLKEMGFSEDVSEITTQGGESAGAAEHVMVSVKDTSAKLAPKVAPARKILKVPAGVVRH